MFEILIAHENNIKRLLSPVSARIHYGARSHSVIHNVIKAIREITVMDSLADLTPDKSEGICK